MADIKIKKDHCPLILTHSLIGGKWKLKILWHILQGDNRFSELKKEIPGISEKSVIFEFERTGGCEAFIQGSN